MRGNCKVMFLVLMMVIFGVPLCGMGDNGKEYRAFKERHGLPELRHHEDIPLWFALSESKIGLQEKRDLESQVVRAVQEESKEARLQQCEELRSHVRDLERARRDQEAYAVATALRLVALLKQLPIEITENIADFAEPRVSDQIFSLEVMAKNVSVRNPRGSMALLHSLLLRRRPPMYYKIPVRGVYYTTDSYTPAGERVFFNDLGDYWGPENREFFHQVYRYASPGPDGRDNLKAGVLQCVMDDMSLHNTSYAWDEQSLDRQAGESAQLIINESGRFRVHLHRHLTDVDLSSKKLYKQIHERSLAPDITSLRTF